MARGKHAVASANRRVQAKDDHIRQLTDQLADAKMRARDAERKAARVDDLERLLAERDSDELLAAALNALDEWKRRAREDRERRRAAARELGRVLRRDVQFAGGWLDYIDFLTQRYPNVIAALFNGAKIRGYGRPGLDRLDAAAARRLTRLRGDRWIIKEDDDRDAADIFIDLLDARDAGFTEEECLELISSGAQS